MRYLKLTLILFSFFIYLFSTAVTRILTAILPKSVQWRSVNVLTNLLIRWFQKIVGIRVDYAGRTELLKETGSFIISRHISYIDGLVLGGLTPATFVSKKEIRSWPIIGWVVRMGGTIFVNRQNKNMILECLNDIQNRLRNKVSILIFPEGTSTDGTQINPFQTSFFSAPIMTGADILPVIIDYLAIDGQPITPETKDNICWYNKMKFAPHLWNLLRFRKIDVRVTVKDKLVLTGAQNGYHDRKKLAQHCYDLIKEAQETNMRLFRGSISDNNRLPSHIRTGG